MQSKINVINTSSPLVSAKGDYDPGSGTGTDDTIAIQAMINSVSSGVVKIPYAKYKLTSTLTIPKNVTLEGVGYPEFYFTGTPDSTNTAIRLNGDYAQCNNLKINVISGDYRKTIGFRANYTKAVGNQVNVTTHDNPKGVAHYVLFASMVPVIINGVEIVDNDVTVKGVQQAEGMQISGCPGIKVIGNNVHDFSVNTPSKSNWGIYVSELSPNALIQDNTVENMPTGGIHIYSTIDNMDGGKVVKHNTIRNCQWNGIGVGYCIGPIIADNVIDNVSQHIYASNTKGGYISGNTFNTGNDTIIDVDRPMVSTINVSGIQLLGNVFGNMGKCKINVITNSSSIKFMSNVNLTSILIG